MRRLWTAVLTGLFALSLQSTAGATTTAANPYTYRECGSGYNLVSGGVIDLRTSGGTLYGQLYVTWNSAQGMNCAIVIKREFVGQPSETSVSIISANSPGTADRGNFEYYAGPVYEPAVGKCIDVTGRVWNPAHSTQASKSKSGWCS